MPHAERHFEQAKMKKDQESHRLHGFFLEKIRVKPNRRFSRREEITSTTALTLRVMMSCKPTIFLTFSSETGWLGVCPPGEDEDGQIAPSEHL